MVAFLDSEIEPTLMNVGVGLTPTDNNRSNDDRLTSDIGRIRDQAFTTPRVTMPNGRDGYALKFDGISDKKLSVDINPEPDFVKKVADYDYDANVCNSRWFFYPLTVPRFYGDQVELARCTPRRFIMSTRREDRLFSVGRLAPFTCLCGEREFVYTRMTALNVDDYQETDPGLKAPVGQTDKKGIPGGVHGNGSLSSGSSIVTISSDAVLDPDAERRKDPSGHGDNKDIRNERWYHTILQVSVPFLIAGLGTIGAGRVLTIAKNMPAFIEVPQLLILTTALQGLKGNLDMCLASRLCTQANLGNMTSRREIIKMIVGNIALVQIQAIVAACCLSLFGMGVGAFNGNGFDWDRALLLAVSCMCTATSSCFILAPYAKTARLLLAMAIPGQLIFVFIADTLNPGDCKLHAYFVISYVVVSLVQVMILLYVAHIIIHVMWRYKIDPDNSAIPYLTALGDLSGSLLLALAFFFIYSLNRPYCVGGP
ncbi:PREDICTED: solute carrier family 41 member 2-like [Wasmannia auropunctata]|uniref:solute carrier family 41 member 2-like n=1 Tax=Wasmannia auropunctata TaxID=64793 RepID=UPI0005EDC896|nr:PREDICTED: solute carrier family 41 member 2-like [Wasmannia auropunctata]